MKLSIFAAIFMAFVAFNQAFSSIIHSVKSEEEMTVADGPLVEAIDASESGNPPSGCPYCDLVGPVQCHIHGQK
ncbi:uncharacterized protein MELLADRAFT_124498 [Melampsora larici-populina 98AG31]|uniref:Secreted protein n=1 Tax=Melampsora larici-populina (strain 98AG31 / pathotype 3-4-7) TaxID=747676 RepID=F4RRE8_MELLP|nr:uncharacterized protein MELLADRAFT_124498 [Melampsora larici-populina 98AG31]EGG05045.1 secreted protein [Melampsora larici-populina 98AG31]